MGATACALLALLRPGDHLLASSWIYGGTRALLTQEFTTFGIDVTLVDPLETRVWRKAMKKHTRAIFVETPVNPTCRVLDLQAITLVTRQSGIALVVDATFASPINFRPLEHGADEHDVVVALRLFVIMLAERSVAIQKERGWDPFISSQPRYNLLEPRIEEVKLFRGSTLMVKFGKDTRVEGDPDNFAFEKVVLKTYRALSGQ